MNQPDLVIAGAPKCGTSSLFNWLVAHPDICGSSIKETFFFMDEKNPLINSHKNIHADGIEAYKYFYQDCRKDKIKLEATTHYMFQDTAVKYFSELNEQPLIVFVLREPSQRIFSSFKYTVNNLGRLDKTISFKQYVRAVLNKEEDKIRPYFYSKESEYVLLRDVVYSQYVNYLKKWETAIGKDRMHIILFEDMVKNPFTVVSNLCNKIGIDTSFYHNFNFTKKNVTVRLKNQKMHRLVQYVNKRLKKMPFKRIFKKMYFQIQEKEKIATITVDEQKILKKLREYYQESNKKLKKGFDLDLSSWDY